MVRVGEVFTPSVKDTSASPLHSLDVTEGHWNFLVVHLNDDQQSRTFQVTFFKDSIMPYARRILIILTYKLFVYSDCCNQDEGTYKFPVDELHPFTSISGRGSAEVKRPPWKHNSTDRQAYVFKKS